MNQAKCGSLNFFTFQVHLGSATVATLFIICGQANVQIKTAFEQKRFILKQETIHIDNDNQVGRKDICNQI